MAKHDLGPFMPSPGTFMAQQGSKIGEGCGVEEGRAGEGEGEDEEREQA